MANPAALTAPIVGGPYPDHLSKYACMFLDNGGVHVNSSIINKAAYQLSSSVGQVLMEKVFFHALKNCLLPTATFTQLRDCAKAAGTVHGVFSQTTSAFNSVGLTASATNPDCGLSEDCVVAIYIPPPAPELVFNPGNPAPDGASLIADAMPHLFGMFGYSSSEPAISQQFVDDLHGSLVDTSLASGDNDLVLDVYSEMLSLNGLQPFVGLTFSEAWNDLPSIWTYQCPPWVCSPF